MSQIYRLNSSRTQYVDSKDAEQARFYRRVIRNIKRKTLPDAQRDVLRALFNLHWKYKNSPGGCIRASRERIAKLAKCSKKTVEVALKRFRQEGIIVTQRYGKGGRKPTVYRFSIEQLMEVYEPTKRPVVIPGKLVELSVKKGVSRASDVRENRAGNANDIYIPYSSYPEASEPDGEDWWAGVISTQDDSPNNPLPEGINSFAGRRVA